MARSAFLATNLLILPGNSPGNRDWTQQLSERFNPHFSQTKIIEYDSWITNDFEKVIDLSQELKKVSDTVKKWDEYYVFAKSVGTALSMRAVHDKVINPQKCVFVGIPLYWLSVNNIPIEDWVNSYRVPTVVIQQKGDPFGGSDKVGEFLQAIPSINEYVVVEGNDHKYLQIDEIVDKTLKFFKK